VEARTAATFRFFTVKVGEPGQGFHGPTTWGETNWAGEPMLVAQQHSLSVELFHGEGNCYPPLDTVRAFANRARFVAYFEDDVPTVLPFAGPLPEIVIGPIWFRHPAALPPIAMAISGGLPTAVSVRLSATVEREDTSYPANQPLFWEFGERAVVDLEAMAWLEAHQGCPSCKPGAPCPAFLTFFGHEPGEDPPSER